MTSGNRAALWVGFFLLLGILSLWFLAVRVSGLSGFFEPEGYEVIASFDQVGRLKVGAPVMISGIRVGKVSALRLDERFRGEATLKIEASYAHLPEDSSAGIYTEGLLGGNYVSLNPGFSESFLKQGSRIEETHSALILENLIGQMFAQLADKKKEPSHVPSSESSPQ